MHFHSVALVSLLASLCAIEALRPRYQHFEDFLNNMDSSEQSWIANSVDEIADDTDEETTKEDGDATSSSTSTTTTTTTTMTPYLQEPGGKSKDVTCCMLGQLAGDKGYHCYTQYYAARLIMRNRNRAHNRKMAFYGPQRVQNYGEKLMHTFEQCVAGRGPIFHKCCHLASMERRVDRFDTAQRARYQRRHQQQQQDDDDDADDEKDS